MLNNTEHKLKQVLTNYSFPSLVKCGLANCRTPHRDGFLVETEDGLETNVGHVCGKRFFGEAFANAKADYERRRELQKLRDRATQLRGLAAQARSQIRDLSESKGGAIWIQRIRERLFKVLGADLFDGLSVLQRRGDFEVKQYRVRSKAEIDLIVDQTRQKREQVRVAVEPIGRLESMPWLTYDFSGTLNGLLSQFDKLDSLDIDRTETPLLRRYVKAVDGWEITIADAQEAINGAFRFFGDENLRLLSLWIPESKGLRRRTFLAWTTSEEMERLQRMDY